MNAELSSKGLSEIIIPTVYREDYMGALKKLMKLRDPDAYIRIFKNSPSLDLSSFEYLDISPSPKTEVENSVPRPTTKEPTH